MQSSVASVSLVLFAMLLETEKEQWIDTLDLDQTDRKPNAKRKPTVLTMLNNILMELRKVSAKEITLGAPKRYVEKLTSVFAMFLAQMANHPLLCRSFYTEDQIVQMAKLLKQHYPVTLPLTSHFYFRFCLLFFGLVCIQTSNLVLMLSFSKPNTYRRNLGVIH